MAVNINVPSQVKTYANLAAFPASGALKTIYIAEDTNKTYRWTGSVYVEVSASASGITIGTTAIASGTVGRVLFEGTGNVVQESANLFWDSTNNRLGIGTSTPTFRLEVEGGDVRFANGLTIGTAGSAGWQFSSNTVTLIQNGFVSVDFANGREFSFTNASFSTTYLKLASVTGNVLIGTTTDAGFRLDVNGTARVKGTGTTSSTTAFTVQNSAGTNMLQLRDDNYQLFGGWLAMESSRYIYKANNATGILTLCNDSTVASFVNLYGSSHATLPNVIDFGTASTSRMVISATGNVGIGTATPAQKLDVVGTIKGTYVNTALVYGSGDLDLAVAGGSTGILIKSATRNVLINTTTDAGFKLDVNGTARVQGDLTIGSGNGFLRGDVNYVRIFSATDQINVFQSARGALAGTLGYFGVTELKASGGVQSSSIGISQSNAFVAISQGNVSNTNLETFVVNRGFFGNVGATDKNLLRISSTLNSNISNGTLLRGIFIDINDTTTFTGFTTVRAIEAPRGGAYFNTTSPQASAVLQADSTTQGFLPPRMTTTQKNAIASPATGLQVFDTTLNQMSYYNGTTWTNI